MLQQAVWREHHCQHPSTLAPSAHRPAPRRLHLHGAVAGSRQNLVTLVPAGKGLGMLLLQPVRDARVRESPSYAGQALQNHQGVAPAGVTDMILGMEERKSVTQRIYPPSDKMNV